MTRDRTPDTPASRPGCAEVVIRAETAEDHQDVREVRTRAFGDADRVPAAFVYSATFRALDRVGLRDSAA